MTIEDYHSQGLVTVISYDTTGWYHSHFLMFRDILQEVPGEWEFCGVTCTRHKLDVTSDVAQDVYITLHTWENRSYPAGCLHTSGNKPHSIH